MRSYRQLFPAALLLFGACGGTIVKFRPRMISQVPDGTHVRFRERSNASTARVGRSLGWASGTPRIITARGDTITIPSGAVLEVRLEHPDGHTNSGAAVGYVAGVLTSLNICGAASACGEENPLPLLGLLVGAFVGHFVTEDWVSLTH